MKPAKHASSVFLLEIIINIFLFVLLMCVCIQFFVKSHQLTRSTTSLHRGVLVCDNIASIYENGNGSLDRLSMEYPNSICFNDHMLIYLDEHMLECDPEGCVYTIEITPWPDTGIWGLRKIDITCQQNTEVVYEITACNYAQRTSIDQGRVRP